MGRSSTGSVTTHAELGLIVTDFFDYNVYDATAGGIAQLVNHYYWNVKQNLFDNGTQSPQTDAEVTFCRPKKVHVYVLPAKGFEIGAGSGPNNTNATGMFAVQAQVSGLGSNLSGAQAYSLDTQVTNVLPQIDTFWKKVFTCNFDQTFKSGVVRPFYAPADPNDMLLFSMSVIDPTDGSTYLPANDTDLLTIRVKVVVEIDQPIATIQNASLAVFKNESFTFPSLAQNGSDYPGTALSYVQTDLKKVRNDMR
jgi:hypothetical protein